MNEIRSFDIGGQAGDAVVPPYADVLRTPESRFTDLPDWPHPPSYVENLTDFEGLRLHYVDLGPPKSDRTVLCLHGQKTWSYAFRNTFSVFQNRGYRVIAPDFLGFGRSDKPVRDNDYSFQLHRNSILELIRTLDLKNVLVCGFDWGGWIGATLPMDTEDRISALLLGNMTLHTPDEDIWPGFHVWLSMHNAQQDPAVGDYLATARPGIESHDLCAYEAPFPDYRYKAGIRRFPNLIPLDDTHPTAAVTLRTKTWLRDHWSGKAILVCGTEDEILGLPSMNKLKKLIRGGPKVIRVDGSGAMIFEKPDSFLDDALATLD